MTCHVRKPNKSFRLTVAMRQFGVLTNRKRAVIALIHSIVFLGVGEFVSAMGILMRWRSINRELRSDAAVGHNCRRQYQAQANAALPALRERSSSMAYRLGHRGRKSWRSRLSMLGWR